MSDFPIHSAADEEWDQLLREWRAQSAGQPRPYFYNRVRARLANASAAARPAAQAWLRWPAYAVMLGMLLLLTGDDAGLPAGSGSGQQAANQFEVGASRQ